MFIFTDYSDGTLFTAEIRLPTFSGALPQSQDKSQLPQNILGGPPEGRCRVEGSQPGSIQPGQADDEDYIWRHMIPRVAKTVRVDDDNIMIDKVYL
ncbi:hypothetical protein WG66_011569, partial [Moniliophthora roreri]